MDEEAPAAVSPAAESAGAAVAAASPPAANAPAAPRRRNLTYEEKLLLIEQKALTPHWTQETLALWAKDVFALEVKPTQATVSNILRASERLRAANVPPSFRTQRPVKFPELDGAVIRWVLTLLERDEPVTRDAIRQHAAAVAHEMRLPSSVKFSKGWASRFMRRHQLHSRRSRSRTGPDDDGADIFLQIVRDEPPPTVSRWNIPAGGSVASEEAASVADSTPQAPPGSTEGAGVSTSSASNGSNSGAGQERALTQKDASGPQQAHVAVAPSVQPEVELQTPSQPQEQTQQQKPPQASRQQQQQRRQQQHVSLKQTETFLQPPQQQDHFVQQQPLQQPLQQQQQQTPSPMPLSVAPVEQPQRQAKTAIPSDQTLRASPTQPKPSRKKQRRQSRQSLELTPDKEREQQLFDLECRKRQLDLETTQVHLMVEKALARKKLLDAGIPEAEVNKLIPL